MKFTAKKIDLDLDLTTLSGDEIPIAGPTFSGREAGELAQRINNGGLEFDKLEIEERTPLAAADLFSEQLCWVYPDIKPEWWVDNFDIGTIKDIRLHIVATLLGVEKKGPSGGK